MATYKLPVGQKLATFKIDELDWEAFKVVCEAQGIPASRALIGFIDSSIKAGKVDESLLPKPKNNSNDIDLGELEDRLMARVNGIEDRLMARLEASLGESSIITQQQTTVIDPDAVNTRFENLEAIIAGK